MLKQSDPLDALFAALADPSRRSMIDRLSRGSASMSELAGPLEMSLPAVQQHLNVLERAGLVSTKKIGRVRSCTLVPNVLSPAQQWIAERRQLWERRLDRLSELFIDTEPTDTSSQTSPDLGTNTPTDTPTKENNK